MATMLEALPFLDEIAVIDGHQVAVFHFLPIEPREALLPPSGP
jgi:hypothetical protein